MTEELRSISKRSGAKEHREVKQKKERTRRGKANEKTRSRNAQKTKKESNRQHALVHVMQTAGKRCSSKAWVNHAAHEKRRKKQKQTQQQIPRDSNDDVHGFVGLSPEELSSETRQWAMPLRAPARAYAISGLSPCFLWRQARTSFLASSKITFAPIWSLSS